MRILAVAVASLTQTHLNLPLPTLQTNTTDLAVCVKSSLAITHMRTLTRIKSGCCAKKKNGRNVRRTHTDNKRNGKTTREATTSKSENAIEMWHDSRQHISDNINIAHNTFMNKYVRFLPV